MFIYIPGEIIAIFTFPGIIMHEIAHRFFADIFNVKVFHIKYFTLFGNTSGHVLLEKTNSFKHNFFISIGPFIINSLLCIILTLPMATILYLQTNFIESYSIFISLTGWIGYSIGYHAIPSKTDLKNIEESAETGLQNDIIFLFKALFYLFNLNYIGWLFSATYCCGISFILPKYILKYYL